MVIKCYHILGVWTPGSADGSGLFITPPGSADGSSARGTMITVFDDAFSLFRVGTFADKLSAFPGGGKYTLELPGGIKER